MATKYTQFGDRPSVTVCVTEADGLLHRETRVSINWSSVGEVGLLDAIGFLGDLKQAVEFATSEVHRVSGIKSTGRG